MNKKYQKKKGNGNQKRIIFYTYDLEDDIINISKEQGVSVSYLLDYWVRQMIGLYKKQKGDN